MEHAAQLTRERNIKLGPMMFPELRKLKGRFPFLTINKLVRESCEHLGIPIFDLLDTFPGRKPEALRVHPGLEVGDLPLSSPDRVMPVVWTLKARIRYVHVMKLIRILL